MSAVGVLQPVRGDDVKASQALSRESLELGTEVVLRNGLRIFIKPTNLFDDEIVLRARRWGGLTEHQCTGCMSGGVVSTEAQVCTLAAMMLGICGLSVESLQESLEGKRLDPSPPQLDAFDTGLGLGASPVDFEDLLMLIHLLFMEPVEASGKSRGRLSLVKLGLIAWRLGEDRDPASRFQRRVMKCVYNNHPYTRTPSLWSILRLNFQNACRVFNERVSRPCEWTFVIAGKLPDNDILLPLLDKYLGSIPNIDRQGPTYRVLPSAERPDEVRVREAVTALDVGFPTKDVREEVWLKMIDPKGSNVLCSDKAKRCYSGGFAVFCGSGAERTLQHKYPAAPLGDPPYRSVAFRAWPSVRSFRG